MVGDPVVLASQVSIDRNHHANFIYLFIYLLCAYNIYLFGTAGGNIWYWVKVIGQPAGIASLLSQAWCQVPFTSRVVSPAPCQTLNMGFSRRVFVCMCNTCAPTACSARGGQRMVLEPLELKLQLVVRHRVARGLNRIWALWRSGQ